MCNKEQQHVLKSCWKQILRAYWTHMCLPQLTTLHPGKTQPQHKSRSYGGVPTAPLDRSAILSS